MSFIHSWKADPPPTLKPDAAYPEWMWDTALYNPPSLAELRVRVDKGEECEWGVGEADGEVGEAAAN